MPRGLRYWTRGSVALHDSGFPAGDVGVSKANPAGPGLGTAEGHVNERFGLLWTANRSILLDLRRFLTYVMCVM